MTVRARTGEPRSFVYSFFTSSSKHRKRVRYITSRCETFARLIYEIRKVSLIITCKLYSSTNISLIMKDDPGIKYYLGNQEINIIYHKLSYYNYILYKLWGCESKFPLWSNSQSSIRDRNPWRLVSRVYKSFYLNLATEKGIGGWFTLRKWNGRPSMAVIGAQIKSLNAKIKYPICLTTIFLSVLRHVVFPLLSGGRQGWIGVVIILNTIVTDTSYRPAATLGSVPPDSLVIEMNR